MSNYEHSYILNFFCKEASCSVEDLWSKAAGGISPPPALEWSIASIKIKDLKLKQR